MTEETEEEKKAAAEAEKKKAAEETEANKYDAEEDTLAKIDNEIQEKTESTTDETKGEEPGDGTEK